MAQHMGVRMPHRHVKAHGENIARKRGFEWLARFGLVARAVIYAVIGLLAVKLALGDGGKAADQQGAMKTIAQQPFGEVLLIVTAIGLFGYASWRLVRGILGHGVEAGEDDTKDRISALTSGIAYGMLFFFAIKILMGSGSGGSGEDKATGGVLGWPGGQIIVAIAGIVLIGVGIDQGIKAFKKKFLEDSKTEEMSEKVQKTFTAVGIFGHLSRMVVFGLMGWFLFKAAIDYDPDKAVALDGALAKLAHASYGPVLLGIVAFGLIGFAAYSAMDARYRRV
jgi:hypothetical protein